LGFGVWGLGRGVEGFGFWVQGLGLKVWGSGFRVWGLGFGVYPEEANEKRSDEVCDEFENNHFTEMCCVTEVGSYVRLIDSCNTQLKAQGPSRTCNDSKEEEDKFWVWSLPRRGR